MNKIRVIGLIGGVLAILVALWSFLIALIFSDVLRGLDMYPTGPNYPLTSAASPLMFIGPLIIGVVGLTTAILGVIGSIIGKKRGGVLMIIAGAVSGLISPFLGILPLILLVIAGAMSITQKPSLPPATQQRIWSLKNGKPKNLKRIKAGQQIRIEKHLVIIALSAIGVKRFLFQLD